jgi:hypothetical protein
MSLDEAVVKALEEHLPIPCQYGAWWTARQLLKKCWQRRLDVIRDTSFDLRELPFLQAARDIIWRRDITENFIGAAVHHYDKNSQYLAACRGVRNGIGDPIHVKGAIEVGRAGIYRIADVKVAGRCDGKDLPLIIEPSQEWVTCDVAVFAREQGYRFRVLEAWVFVRSAKILDDWAYTLWNARQALKSARDTRLNDDIRDAAYRRIKEIALVGVGSFATGKEKHPGIDLIHPNWWADVVGKARVNLLANLLKWEESPVLIETDGLYFVLWDWNPRTAIRGILDREGQCGGYKHVRSTWLSRELQTRSVGLLPGEMASLLKGRE